MKLNRADSIKAKEIADKHGVTIDEMKKIISAPYDFIQKKAKEIKLEDDLTREEFDAIKKNFNIPALGKLYASHYQYNEIQKKKKKKLGGNQDKL